MGMGLEEPDSEEFDYNHEPENLDVNGSETVIGNGEPAFDDDEHGFPSLGLG